MPADRPIERLLVANRGEIAVRIARTARTLGISTVGVFSEPDRAALHVSMMDRAASLGGSSPAESYLLVDKVIDGALRCGADAVHPGYGFLAERADVAAAVEAAGLVWVGPTAEQIRLLGDKLTAKRLAAEVGVPTTSVVELGGDDDVASEPPDVPLPAIVKAAAGGGGRGMRVVRSRDELPGAIESASREALAAFGDGTVFVEPFLEAGRHIEVQVLGDHHGNVIHLGERECSIQRRNQKVVEEAPSAGIDDELRSQLCEGAVSLARHVGYRNAATVEYLVGADGTVTFLEVNTRLQVEHPVTEAVTGLDLVELQLRIAGGEPLPVAQGDISTDGHAIEVRLVAEDPSAGWLPSTGRLARFEIAKGVRCDTGVQSGDTVSADYDSLLAKVIAHGPDRRDAARRLADALDRSWVAGVRTNRESMVALLRDPDFLDGALSTAYLDAHPEVAHVRPDEATRLLLAAAVALTDELDARQADERWGFAPSGWRNLRTVGARSTWTDEHGDEVQLELTRRTSTEAELCIGPWPLPDAEGALDDDTRVVHHLRTLAVDESTLLLEVDGIAASVRRATVDGEVHVSTAGGAATWRRAPVFADHDAAIAGEGPTAPLPGTVLKLLVGAGDVVGDGDPLVVIEAMKMEHTISAAGDGTVTEVRVAEGDRVDAGDLLVIIDR